MSFKAYPRNAKEIENDGKENVLTSLKAGNTTIRVMPPYSDRGCWFKKINEYYFKLGDQHLYFPSPRDFGEEDPILDYCERVWQSEDEDAMKITKDWKPRLRYLVNVFILAEPSPVERNNIVVLKTPAKVLKELRTYDIDSAAGYGDITSVENGFNFNIKKEGKMLSTTYSVTPHRQNSNIMTLLKDRNLDLNSMTLHNLDTVYPTKSFDELMSILDTLKSMGNSTPVETNSSEPANIEVVGGTPAREVKIEVASSEGE